MYLEFRTTLSIAMSTITASQSRCLNNFVHENFSHNKNCTVMSPVIANVGSLLQSVLVEAGRMKCSFSVHQILGASNVPPKTNQFLLVSDWHLYSIMKNMRNFFQIFSKYLVFEYKRARLINIFPSN